MKLNLFAFVESYSAYENCQGHLSLGSKTVACDICQFKRKFSESIKLDFISLMTDL